MELKDTLLMPKTNFEMRGNLSVKEPLLVSKWNENHLYDEMIKNNENCPTFMLHDGPPYANGNIHCGHMLNRCLKDFIVREKTMLGYKTPFIPGWDTHGLPIEVQVTKSGVNRKETPLVDFRKICGEYALKQVENQKAQMVRLGIMGDFAHPYITLQKEYEAKQIEAFASMALKGLIFKGVKPVYWSPSSESALAEAEIEYKDVKARTMYVTFDVYDGNGIIPITSKILIWTTTPWTIPADLAITLNPKFEYGLFDTEFGELVFLKSRAEALKEEIGFKKCELVKTFLGEELENASVRHVLYNRLSKVICNAYVTDDSGTGCVHTAPDHGVDDFNACAKYGIKPFCPVDSRGYLRLEEGDPLNGLFYEEANDKVVDMLAENGHLIKEIDIVHSYPHDWRTKKPVIFRATPQWFCSIDPIREDLLNAVHQINWIPAWGENKMVNMIKDRADWCISRQRAWGVPLPIIYNEDGSPILEKEVFDRIASLIRENGSDIWFKLSPKEILPEGYVNAASPNGEFTKEKDIMDVWFDSGSSWNGTLVNRGLPYPADLYLEGNDQYRGWFNASMIVSMAVNGVAPFKTCLTHGWVMDENWQKMSKSSGNGIDPNKIASIYGADILRLWASLVDYRSDVKISENIIQSISENYRKIRNTFRFMLGNLQNGEGKVYVQPETKPTLRKIDEWILAEHESLKNHCLKCYDNFDFAGVTNSIINFLVGDLSSFYLDQAKDALYCDSINSIRRQGLQYVIYKITKELTLLLNPIIPFTMDEVYKEIPGVTKVSPQLDDMPKETHEYDESVLKEFESFKNLKETVYKELEIKRAAGEIGSSSEAAVEVSINEGNLFNLVKDEDLATIFIVSEVVVKQGNDQVTVKKAEGELCPRCRKYHKHFEDVDGNKVCTRCASVLKGE